MRSRDLWLLRDYFGEQTALYFGFVEFLIKSTWAVSFVGVGLLVWQIVFFFQEIQRRSVAGFWTFTAAHANATGGGGISIGPQETETAMSFLTKSCSDVGLAYGAAGYTCPPQFFELPRALELYNATGTTSSLLRADVTADTLVPLCESFVNAWRFNSAPILPFLALGVIAWCVFTGVLWTRRQSTYAMEWGTTGCEDAETVRWSFQTSKDTGTFPDPITGADRHVAYPWRRLLSRCETRGIMLTMLLCVMALTVGVVSLRTFLSSPSLQNDPLLRSWAGVICGLINSVQIMVCGKIWKAIALKLNNRENWKTDTEWEDALTAKTFLFSFVNNYSGCFYIVLLQSNVSVSRDWLGSEDKFVPGQCGQPNGGCLRVLGVNLITIFCSKLILGNVWEVWTILRANVFCKCCCCTRHNEQAALTKAEAVQAIDQMRMSIAVDGGDEDDDEDDEGDEGDEDDKGDTDDEGVFEDIGQDSRHQNPLHHAENKSSAQDQKKPNIATIARRKERRSLNEVMLSLHPMERDHLLPKYTVFSRTYDYLE